MIIVLRMLFTIMLLKIVKLFLQHNYIFSRSITLNLKIISIIYMFQGNKFF